MRVIAITILVLLYQAAAFAIGFFVPAEPVNNVLGDISFIEKYNTTPTAQTDENLRISTHLAFVEAYLKGQATQHLTADQKANRSKMIALLHEYRLAQRFPKNHHFNQRTSVFIDRDKNICAVGYLVQQTAGNAVAEKINSRYKFASIYDMQMPKLEKWIAQSGLNKDECAMIQPTYGGGNIIVPPNPRRPRTTAGLFPMQTRSVQINTTLTGQASTTTIDQVFFNPTRNQLQGYYFFPIPQEASIDKFSMWINGKETKGEVLDAQKARKIYEDIVQRSQDPALLEYYNQKLFRVRIFPIQPQSEQRVKLTYTQSLVKENGTIEYNFPIGAVENIANKTIPNLSFKINLETQGDLKNIYSPTHEIEVVRKGKDKATIGFEGKNLNTEASFKLYYNTNKSKVGLSTLNYNDGEEAGFFFMNLSPGVSNKSEIINKDITFVLDASGSMAGEKMEQAKKALQFCIANLNDKDRFNIVRFSTESSTLFENLKEASATNRKEARIYIKDLRAIGGTNIGEALEQALSHKKEKNRPYSVIFMTDGKPTIGETDEAALLNRVKTKNGNDTKIFTFGIGTKLNTHLLDKLTEMTQAYRTYVLPEEDIEVKVSDFYTKVASPVLTDIKIKFDRTVRVTDVQPKALPDLFKGSTLTLLGRYNGSGKGKVTVEGKVNGKTKTYVFDVNFDKKTKKQDFIPSLWATRTVGHLLDQIRLNGKKKELIDEVVRLSKKYGIVTPYTSYLILEDEALSVRTNRIQQRDQLIRGRVQKDEKFVQDRVTSYNNATKKKEGRASVEISEESQSLNEVVVTSLPTQAKTVLDYKDLEGNTKNLAQDIVNLNGRAFYNNNNVWIDSHVQQNIKKPVNRIKFNSTQYFKLIKEEPEVNAYLALGRNVRFVLKKKVYEIYE